MSTIILLAIILLPLAGSLYAGLISKSKNSTTSVVIPCIVGSWLLSSYVSYMVWTYGINQTIDLYSFIKLYGVDFRINLLLDRLTAMMLMVVTSISMLVHIYTIEYMKDDEGYSRFFSYISLFTFSMLCLVMSANFIVLFFGWEAVGLVSYLLIGFWYKKESAIFANLKAFLVNRVGDFGFILGIAMIVSYTHSTDYSAALALKDKMNVCQLIIMAKHIHMISLAAILLFIGAMGKSAQFPLHVWLPDSMEGPTPISALIHAATMVTAGIFMVSRLYFIFDLAPDALNFIAIIGSITALFMGLLAIVQYDIKRVVAYSTLSQLGYMTAALGMGCYPFACFHLLTHAFFKALLFLASGSVIIAMHHEQDMRKMGGLYKYIPISFALFLIGTLALVGLPFSSGFYSKDSIIEMAAEVAPKLYGGSFIYYSLLSGIFITSLYSFRALFLVFGGKKAYDNHQTPHEPSYIILGPLLALAVPSIILGYIIYPYVLGSQFIGISSYPYISSFSMGVHGLHSIAFLLLILGAVVARILVMFNPPFIIKPIRHVLEHNYYIDYIYQFIFVKFSVYMSKILTKFVDQAIIDRRTYNIASLVSICSSKLKLVQNGNLDNYAFYIVLSTLMFIFISNNV